MSYYLNISLLCITDSYVVSAFDKYLHVAFVP